MMFACKRLSVGQQRCPFIWSDKGGREDLWKVFVFILVADEKVQFVWAMSFRRCHGHSRDDLRIVLAIGSGDDSCSVHCNLLAVAPIKAPS